MCTRMFTIKIYKFCSNSHDNFMFTKYILHIIYYRIFLHNYNYNLQLLENTEMVACTFFVKTITNDVLCFKNKGY